MTLVMSGLLILVLFVIMCLCFAMSWRKREIEELQKTVKELQQVIRGFGADHLALYESTQEETEGTKNRLFAIERGNQAINEQLFDIRKQLGEGD